MEFLAEPRRTTEPVTGTTQVGWLFDGTYTISGAATVYDCLKAVCFRAECPIEFLGSGDATRDKSSAGYTKVSRAFDV